MREALAVFLKAKGLVDYTATRRSRVANPSLEELSNSMKVLGSLEALAGSWPVLMQPMQSLKKLPFLTSRCQTEAITCCRLISSRRTCSSTQPLCASRNESLIDTHQKFNARLWRARFLSSRKIDARVTTLNQHNDITDALTRRDAKAAAEAMRIHIETAIGNLVMSDDGQETSPAKPRIGIIPGDPGGIGPELIAKLLSDPEVKPKSRHSADW